MARRGENIYKRKDNRWEGRYIKGYDFTGKAQYGYVYSRTYKEVREKLHNAKNGTFTNDHRRNKVFSDFCDEWLCLSRNRVKESTLVKYHNNVNRHIRPFLGSYPVQSISAMHIEMFSSELLQNGLSQKTVKDILSLLRNILDYACSTENISTVPFKIVYPKEKEKEMRVLTVEEQKRFIQYLMCSLNNVKFGILLALVTGMRIGEICALKWENISMEERTITVTATMQRLQSMQPDDNPRTKITIGDTKSHSSTRVIPLSEFALSLCERMRPEQGTGYILTGSGTQFMEPRLLQYYMKKYTQACGLEGVHFHTLRHTFATRCVEVGFEIKSLSEVLGHASTRVTLDRYVHSSINLKRANIEKLSAIGM